ncbi:potassium channel family protein [Streptomyces sp. NPDC058662]|uniref:potassium channel family protein n=1 Tax=Streptomyces sp. NPDC058662 TaxID=3346583 RepID=UPI00365FB7DE
MPRNAAPRRRRLLVPVGHALRSAASAAVLTALFYVAPLDSGFGALTLLCLALGLLLFGGLVAWQVSRIANSRHPRLRAMEALATAVPLFLVLFASAYFLLSAQLPESFTEPLSRTDSLYFTVTVFATVGFGDIAATTQAARALTTGQMIADLIVVGVVAKVLFGAVRVGLRRRGEAPADPDGGP